MLENLNSFTRYSFPQETDGSILFLHIQWTKMILAICLFSGKTFFGVA
jgi:hypothetical protein